MSTPAHNQMWKLLHHCRHTKLRLFDMADEFDLLLYLDADTMATGRVEAALDLFAPGGKPPPGVHMGAARDYHRQFFNSGLMAIAPSHDFFADLIAAGRNGSVEYRGGTADQGFLNGLLNVRGTAASDPMPPPRYSWTELPPAVNLLCGGDFYHDPDVDATRDKAFFVRNFRDALLVHWAGTNQLLRDRIELNDARTKIIATSDGERSRAVDALWVDAWTEARRLLSLPRPLPTAEAMSAVVARLAATDRLGQRGVGNRGVAKGTPVGRRTGGAGAAQSRRRGASGAGGSGGADGTAKQRPGGRGLLDGSSSDALHEVAMGGGAGDL